MKHFFIFMIYVLMAQHLMACNANDHSDHQLGGWITGHSQFLNQLSGRMWNDYGAFQPITGRQYPRQLQFASDGKSLLSLGNKDELIMWDLQIRQPVDQSPIKSTVRWRINGDRQFRLLQKIALIDKDRLAVAYVQGLLYFNAESGQLIDSRVSLKKINFLHYSNGRWLYVDADRSTLGLLCENHTGGSWEIKLPYNEIYTAALSPDGNLLAVNAGAHRDGVLVEESSVYLYDIKTKTCLSELPVASLERKHVEHQKRHHAFKMDQVQSLELQLFGSVQTTHWAEELQLLPGNSDDGLQLIVSTYSRGSRLWHLDLSQPGRVAYTFDHHRPAGIVRKMTGEKSSCTADIENGPYYYSHPIIRLYPTADPLYAVQLKGHRAPVYDAVFSPDGALLVTGGKDQIIRIWETKCAEGEQLLNKSSCLNAICRENVERPSLMQ